MRCSARPFAESTSAPPSGRPRRTRLRRPRSGSSPSAHQGFSVGGCGGSVGRPRSSTIIRTLRSPYRVYSRQASSPFNAQSGLIGESLSIYADFGTPIGGCMDVGTHKKFTGDRLMPWGKATVVKDAKGYVFLAGNAATGEDYDPLNQRGGATGDPAMQWRAILANIKSDLEEV